MRGLTELEGLPAGAQVRRGLRDLMEGDVTIDALMVAIASHRLTDLGLPIPPRSTLPPDAELALYELLCARSEDPYSEYRALLGDLDSFISSLEARRAFARDER